MKKSIEKNQIIYKIKSNLIKSFYFIRNTLINFS